MQLTTLKKRSEFLRLRGGFRYATSSFILETRPRAVQENKKNYPRFGFTVTKALGKAVVRNRIRRRLKAALQALSKDFTHPENDYVLIARRSALCIPFSQLRKDLEVAFDRVHHAQSASDK